MRIAMLAACPFPSSQGSQVFVREMCESLGGRGHEIELLTYGQGEHDCVAPTAYRHRRIRRLPGDDAMRSGPTAVKPLLDGLLAAELCRTTRSGAFDVIHAHVFEAAAIAVATKPFHRLPVVYHCHGAMAEELPTYFRVPVVKRAAQVIGRAFDRSVPRAADLTVALSGAARDTLRALGVPGDRLAVIPPAVADPGEPASCDRARNALAIGAGRFVVGYCGNLDGYQNLDVLAAAVRTLAEGGRVPEPLWLVITHARDPDFARRVAAAGALRWTRIVDARDFAQARLAMAACDALVLPRATATGFPIKLLNYLASYRPVVVGAGAASLVTDGREAVTVADGSPSGYAAALERLAGKPGLGLALAAGARQKYLQDHTWAAVAPALEDAYARVVRPSHAVRQVAAMLR